MNQQTHPNIDARLVGRPLELTPGSARVELVITAEMAADERGLSHGGFTFGLADYAAMLAVNESTVVLSSATTRFLKPVRVGDKIVAVASVEKSEGKSRHVKAIARRDDEVVFEGEFQCVVPSRHVLDIAGRK